jgi:hypothetical protein
MKTVLITTLTAMALIAPATAGAAQLKVPEAEHVARVMLRSLAEELDGRVQAVRCLPGGRATVGCRAAMRLPDASCRLRIHVRERRGDYVGHVRSMRCR